MKTQVLIIGGGATGTGLARDLALRGLQCLLVEKKDINAGASGGNHGLLHSGARYVASDPEAARECREEGELLKHLAPHCIEKTGGLFVAVEGDDEDYIARFPGLCEKAGVPARALDLKEARLLEPALSKKLIAAYAVEDGSIDPFRLSLDNLAQAGEHGADLLCFTRVAAFEIGNSKIQSVKLENTLSGESLSVEADIIINAAGAWAGLVAGLAGLSVPVLYSKGSLIITQERMNHRVINRLRPASNADILVPGGTVSILGTTSIRIEHPDHAYPTVEEIEIMIEDAKAMIPALETARYIRAYCGVRPLVGSPGGGEDRKVTRGFVLLDHSAQGLNNFITITGGKLTTFRLMAEKTADLVCDHLGLIRPCLTRTEPLPASSSVRWTEPAGAPRVWLTGHDPQDTVLCECEMVPRSAIDSIVDALKNQGIKADLLAIGLRSRIGKGRCQGSFCAPRIAASLYQQGEMSASQTIDGLREFIRNRWKGLQPVLWGDQLAQAELSEAVHCGFLGLEGEEGENGRV
ncbi:MAG: anaerobic glycerol-3-phosphate dehydrogenase subunit GlpA [Thermodesulfobacteriota bacterium]